MVNIAKLTKKRLGEILVSEGLVNDEQIQEALKKQSESGELLGEILVRLGYVTEGDIARTIATQFSLPYIDASRYNIGKEIVDLLPIESLMENQFVALDRIGKTLIIAVSGLLNEKVFEELERKTGCQIQLYVSTAAQVAKAVKQYWPRVKAGS